MERVGECEIYTCTQLRHNTYVYIRTHSYFFTHMHAHTHNMCTHTYMYMCTCLHRANCVSSSEHCPKFLARDSMHACMPIREGGRDGT